jgi:hypothetical protein
MTPRITSPAGSAAATSHSGALGQARRSMAGTSERMAWTATGTTGAPRATHSPDSMLATAASTGDTATTATSARNSPRSDDPLA